MVGLIPAIFGQQQIQGVLKQLDECLFLFYIDKIELKSSNYKWSIIIHFWNLTTPDVIGTENLSNFEIEVSVATYAQTHAWSLHV